MPNLYPRKGRPFFFLFIMSCCVIIMIAGSLIVQPSSNPKHLSALLLNKDAAPTFHLTSQLTYTPELIDAWPYFSAASLAQSTTSA